MKMKTCVLSCLVVAGAVASAESLGVHDSNEDYDKCTADDSCPEKKFCSKQGRCIDCYNCRYFNRDDDPTIRRSCAKLPQDCGKCIPGFELERCSGGMYCDKCVRIRIQPGLRSTTSKPDSQLILFNMNNNESSKDEGSGMMYIVTGVVCILVFGFLVIVAWFVSKAIAKKKERLPPVHKKGDSEQPRTPLLDPELPPLTVENRPASSFHGVVDSGGTQFVNENCQRAQPIVSENRQRAVPFRLPSAAYEASAMQPTAPPLSNTGDSNVSSGGSTVPSNWEPRSQTVRLDDCEHPSGSAPGGSAVEADHSDGHHNVLNWLRQITSAVSESSVFSSRDDVIQPPEAFIYRSVDNVNDSQIQRSSSVTLFSRPNYASGRTVDSGIGHSRHHSGATPPLVLNAEMDLTIVFGVTTRRSNGNEESPDD